MEWQTPGYQGVSFDRDLIRYQIYMGKDGESLNLISDSLWRNKANSTQFIVENLELGQTNNWYLKAHDGNNVWKSEITTFSVTQELPSFSFVNKILMVAPFLGKPDYAPGTLVVERIENNVTNRKDGQFNIFILIKDFERFQKQSFTEAAKYCWDLVAYGYDDWYLSAIIELIEVYHYLEENNIVPRNDLYRAFWSSTESQSWYIALSLKYNLNGSNEHEEFVQRELPCRCVRQVQE